eukprot:5971677-Lingulodinium_polyedra.AAC.1
MQDLAACIFNGTCKMGTHTQRHEFAQPEMPMHMQGLGQPMVVGGVTRCTHNVDDLGTSGACSWTAPWSGPTVSVAR